ncbi:calcium:proton antiporter [Terrirubrum flagellatum]|uniref:calcium:proton antiporter n=1 Tax=Terrirubrum flagellatum TaxID=2895980 RepID=UPI003CC824CA
MPWSAWVFPLLAFILFGVASVAGSEGALRVALSIILFPVLMGTVFAAVHHAELIAHRTGEPYGTLVLTGAVTIIEVALIASIMLSSDSSPTLARDTVFAVVMIVCNGLVGLCVVVGGLRYGEQGFRTKGAASYLTVLIAMAALTMVLPNFTRTTPGPVYSSSQLIFVSVVTLVLYGAFLYIQTVRHRDYFIIFGDQAEDGEHESAVSDRTALISVALLVAALVGVILLAKKFATVVEAAVAAAGAPYAVVGVIVALLILLPEGVAAIRAAKRDELQKSVNLALGSSLATIGLTVPAVAMMSILLKKPLTLGLDSSDSVLLTVTILISMLTFGAGRTNILFGVVHLVMFATYVFLTFVP